MIIYKNSQKLMLLVNQLMDWQKDQADELKLKVEPHNLNTFLEEIYLSFKPLAENGHIDFKFQFQDSSEKAWFDPSALEKIIYNLLSNALKYTLPNESVVFTGKRLHRSELENEFNDIIYKHNYNQNQSEHFSLIEVKDTGIGISDNEKENIFMPFFQINNHKKTANMDGTGIGLSLTQSLVKLHHGLIEVVNNKPKGTIFKVIIPIDEKAYSDVEKVSEITDELNLNNQIVIKRTQETDYSFKSKTILIVEDNQDIAKYLKEYLQPYYQQVLVAFDGEEGLKIAKSELPDLIVSDIMMPKMNGLDLCTTIKDDLEMGHIPVILATARTMVPHIKEGYLSGADDYIIKPFNVEILVLRINNLLNQREKLKEMYGKKFSPETIGVSVNSADDRFMQRLYEIIEKNISDPALNVEFIYNELGFSRSNFYRKINAITDMDPAEIIRRKKLEIAIQMLLDNKYNISEVADLIGFNSSAQFTRSFKSMFGVTPSEYLKQKNLNYLTH